MAALVQEASAVSFQKPLGKDATGDGTGGMEVTTLMLGSGKSPVQANLQAGLAVLETLRLPRPCQ